MLTRLRVSIAALFLLGGSATSAWCQDATGRITGLVTDSSGAVIADARVSVENLATTLRTTVPSDATGLYQALLLPIGNYRVTVEAPGFRKVVVDDLKLLINQTLRVDVKLEVGQVSETVQVEGQASGVETVNVTLGASVTDRPIINMPLNGRNVLDLARLQPGVTTARPASQSGAAGLFNVAGGRSDSVTFLLDGGVNNNLLSNGVVYNPNPDSIAEFRILTSNYTAEFGRNGAGVVSVVTKSGTNALHGSGFEFLRNEALNANRFFNNANRLPKEVLKRNQYGFTLGGPVVIPKVYNGKDKLFFFNSFQKQTLRNLASAIGFQTFTPEELRGDFSRSRNGGPDAGVASFLQRYPYFQANPELAARAIIDPARFNTVSRNYIQAGLIETAPSGQLFAQGSRLDDRKENTTKVDFTPRQNDRFSVTLGVNTNPTRNPFPTTGNGSNYPTTTNFKQLFGNASYVKVFSANLLNDFRFTAQRAAQLQQVPAVDRPKAADLGVGITPDRASGPPILNFASGAFYGFNPNGPTSLINNTYIYADTLTWIKGKHNFKSGFTLSAYQNNTIYDFYVNGMFSFSGAVNSGGIGSGNDRADFLFGLPDAYQQFPSAPSDIRSKMYSAFFQDEWRVNRKLTLTMGLRYDYSQPKFDTRGRSFSLKQGERSTVFPGAPIGLLFPGDPQAPKGANFPDRNDFAPRFGFAYSPTSKWSVRGGFGLFYDVLKGEDNLQFNGQAPFFAFTQLFFNPLPAGAAGEVRYFQNPFGSTGSVNPFPSKPPARDLNFAAAGFTPIGGSAVYFVNPRLRTPYVMQYNLSVQRELARGTVLEVNYVGSGSRKLTALVDVNPMLPGTTARLFTTTPGNAANSFSFLDSFENVANSSYNSLQVGLTKRPTGGNSKLGELYYQLSYTYGKTIDNASGFRETGTRAPYFNRGQFRGVSDFDVTHNFVFSGGWDLPFAKMWTGGPKLLTRGWSLYPILSLNTGFPIDVTARLSRTRTRTGPSGLGDPNIVRADLVAASETTFNPHQVQTINGRTGNFWFDPRAFSNARFTTAFDAQVVANPSLATYGTLGRNAFRLPGRANFDLAVAKTFFFGERVRSEFRAEAFNLMNNAQWRDVSTSIVAGAFGQATQTYDPRIVQLALRISF